MENTNDIWRQENSSWLADVLTDICDRNLMRAFLRDVMTEKEITEISSRLRAAQMLREGYSYGAIIQETKISSRTVARISDWLQNGAGGYSAVLDQSHHTHILPAHAE